MAFLGIWEQGLSLGMYDAVAVLGNIGAGYS